MHEKRKDLWQVLTWFSPSDSFFFACKAWNKRFCSSSSFIKSLFCCYEGRVLLAKLWDTGKQKDDSSKHSSRIQAASNCIYSQQLNLFKQES